MLIAALWKWFATTQSTLHYCAQPQAMLKNVLMQNDPTSTSSSLQHTIMESEVTNLPDIGSEEGVL
jgi:hypothetical protein